MPFRSEKQRRFMWAQHPDIAREWSDEQKRKGAPLVVGKMSERAAHERRVRSSLSALADPFGLDDAAQARIYAKMVGKAEGTLVSNVGPSPAPYDPIPDFTELYYQPDDDPRREDESAAAENRRRSTAAQARGKYGFHGTAEVGNEPALRYEDGDFPLIERRDDHATQAYLPIPNMYRQPISNPDEDDGEAASQRIASGTPKASAPTRGPVQKRKQRFIIPKSKV